jgi:uncharacterized protein YegJ (DUF2314 family)
MRRLLTWVICSAAIIATILIALQEPNIPLPYNQTVRMSAEQGSGALKALLWATSPYAGLAVLALLARRSAARSVLIVTLVIAMAGVIMLWLLHEPPYWDNPPTALPLELELFAPLGFIPLGQWLLIAVAVMAVRPEPAIPSWPRQGVRPMLRNPLTALATCAYGALVTVAFMFWEAYKPIFSPGDAVVLWILWAIGPYLGLAVLTWLVRRRERAVFAALIAIGLITVPGLFLVSPLVYETPHPGAWFSWNGAVPFMVVPAGQWVLVGVAAVVVLVIWLGDRTLDAINEARRRWPEFVRAFEDREPDHTFAVKARIEEDDAYEFMWIVVDRLEGNQISGKINNEPVELKQVRLGDVWTLKREDVLDWLFTTPEGVHGGFSDSSRRRRQPGRPSQLGE